MHKGVQKRMENLTWFINGITMQKWETFVSPCYLFTSPYLKVSHKWQLRLL